MISLYRGPPDGPRSTMMGLSLGSGTTRGLREASSTDGDNLGVKNRGIPAIMKAAASSKE